jgi:toxin ParE1/3/4
MGAVYWRPQAINDLVRIGRHIAINSAVNADNVVAELQAKTAALASYPNMGRIGRIAGTRELVVHTHYIVIYRASGSTVQIIRVKHTARKGP